MSACHRCAGNHTISLQECERASRAPITLDTYPSLHLSQGSHIAQETSPSFSRLPRPSPTRLPRDYSDRGDRSDYLPGLGHFPDADRTFQMYLNAGRVSPTDRPFLEDGRKTTPEREGSHLPAREYSYSWSRSRSPSRSGRRPDPRRAPSPSRGRRRNRSRHRSRSPSYLYEYEHEYEYSHPRSYTPAPMPPRTRSHPTFSEMLAAVREPTPDVDPNPVQPRNSPEGLDSNNPYFPPEYTEYGGITEHEGPGPSSDTSDSVTEITPPGTPADSALLEMERGVADIRIVDADADVAVDSSGSMPMHHAYGI
ncbi:hypothetical protein K491DRAFT_774752 [Lophiostoma macrostomum CBS 122681]|uniref:Uncharacterized protein n=1 Tax=Lophiostoma macrostomum CBS 122681 TaxID=1314788 RepID=A0A6A6TKL1_9PLEO|nr:hypothetical protein K491DRAFT_774752 [Lophiostoma macrostomum CBS 122681]